VTISTETAKTKRVRVIPLTSKARTALKGWKDQTEAPFPEFEVFVSDRTGGPLGDIKRVWRKLLKDAELPHLRLHDIRHTTATTALQHSDLKVVQSILGHAQITTTARYLHPDREQMRAALEGMDSRTDNVTRLKRRKKS
jgi:integrase